MFVVVELAIVELVIRHQEHSMDSFATNAIFVACCFDAKLLVKNSGCFLTNVGMLIDGYFG